MKESRFFLVVITLLWMNVITAFTQIKVNERLVSTEDFPLVEQGKAATINIDPTDYEVVDIVANMFAEDIQRVTGRKAKVNHIVDVKNKNLIIIGTLGKNQLIDQWVASGKLNVSALRDGWEQYVIQTLDNPKKGIEKALVIVGCDRRGSYWCFSTLLVGGCANKKAEIIVYCSNKLHIEKTKRKIPRNFHQ